VAATTSRYKGGPAESDGEAVGWSGAGEADGTIRAELPVQAPARRSNASGTNRTLMGFLRLTYAQPVRPVLDDGR